MNTPMPVKQAQAKHRAACQRQVKAQAALNAAQAKYLAAKRAVSDAQDDLDTAHFIEARAKALRAAAP